MAESIVVSSETKGVGLITLFLMTEKGYELLRAIAERFKSILSLVVVGEDKSIQKDWSFEIIQLCIENGIEFVKRSEFIKIESEYALAVSWRWLIEHPEDKLIIFHDSILPKYRGFAPLVNALINGEVEIGVSAIFGASDFDTGDIIVQSKSTITYPIKIYNAIQIINKNYLDCAEIILGKLLTGKLIAGQKQDESNASYSLWRDEQDYVINWGDSACNIRRMIDAVGFPYKGATTVWDGKLIRILNAEELSDVRIENRDSGKVLFINQGCPVVVCGRGLLKITEAVIEDNGMATSFLPLSRLRIRFTNI